MFIWVQICGHGRPGEDVVVGEELGGVACCMRSGVVVSRHSAIQRLMRRKDSKKKDFFFFNTICVFKGTTTACILLSACGITLGVLRPCPTSGTNMHAEKLQPLH